MTKCRKFSNKFVLTTTLICLPGISLAATTVSDDFDAGLGSWTENTSETTNSHQPAGGNPNGYLFTDNTGSFGVMGASNQSSDYSVLALLA